MTSKEEQGRQAETALRVAALLAHEPTVTEVKMFGGHGFKVRDKLVVSVGREGDLLVRVAAARDEALRARPGTSRATMGKGRAMSIGWINVEHAEIESDEALAAWVDEAMEFNRSLTSSSVDADTRDRADGDRRSG